MNAAPSAKRILIYGDSLVYGKASGRNKRLDISTRFSGVLQVILGDGYEIIEEGLRGRTLNGENAFFKDRNGLIQFSPIIGSHLPVDLVVILLGTNDCNAGAHKSPEDIAESLRYYPPKIQEWGEFLSVPLPKILVLAPPKINSAFYDEACAEVFGDEAPDKANALPILYEQIAKELNADFLNLAEVCEPARGDGIHLDESGNRAVAEAIAGKIRS
jgi:lysophospholipase L1-like esterase